MAGRTFHYDPPDRFVAGTVGQPGSRTFFLQSRGNLPGGRPALTSVALEKQQVAALAERVDDLLDEVLRRSGGSAAPAVAPHALDDLAPLDTPLDEEFRVGTMSLAWDGDRERVVIECFEVGDSDAAEEDLGDGDDARPEGDVLRVVLTAAAARAFAKRALAVIEAGRPPCPLCDEPLDPEGHICPRANGYRR